MRCEFVFGFLWLLLSSVACSHSPSGSRSTSPGEKPKSGAIGKRGGGNASPAWGAGENDLSVLLAKAERTADEGQIAKSLLLFSQCADLAAEQGDDSLRFQALEGMARSHEKLGNFPGAIRVYQLLVDSFERSQLPNRQVSHIFANKGACEAEVEDWSASAQSYSLAQNVDGRAEPSFAVELRAREGFALFQAENWDLASQAFNSAEQIFQDATEQNLERFDSLYFVAMARFYLGAIEHRKFRALPIRAAKAQMTLDFEEKMRLLQVAQDHYRQTIRTNHVFWVSAAGYQMGALLSEFYDALMYAPVPSWLSARDRLVYYEELKKQLRPIVDKAIWVYEKNIETARRLGYKTEFVTRTERQLNSLQAILRTGDSGLGKPLPRLSPGREQERDLEVLALQDPHRSMEKKVFLPNLRPL